MLRKALFHFTSPGSACELNYSAPGWIEDYNKPYGHTGVEGLSGISHSCKNQLKAP